MNILNIALKEIKGLIRRPRSFIFLLAFPLVLILILGTALSSAFSSDRSISLDKISIIYKEEGKGDVSVYFNKFVEESEKQGIKLQKVSDDNSAMSDIQKDKFAGYVKIEDDDIKLYENSRTTIEKDIVEGMLKAFIDKYKLASEVVKVKPQALSAVMASDNDNSYIKESSLNAKSTPSAIDYYSVAMTTMIALYGALSACFLIRGEKVNNTASRLMSAPIKKSDILIGKVLGGIVSNFICVLAIIAVSKIVYKANWGDNIFLVALVLLTEVILAISFGLGVSYIVKRPETPRTIVMLVVQVASFVGGAYFPISSDSSPPGIINFLIKLSPLSWNNEAINKIIYTANNNAAIPAIIINLAAASMFLLIAAVIAGRREAL